MQGTQRWYAASGLGAKGKARRGFDKRFDWVNHASIFSHTQTSAPIFNVWVQSPNPESQFTFSLCWVWCFGQISQLSTDFSATFRTLINSRTLWRNCFHDTCMDLSSNIQRVGTEYESWMHGSPFHFVVFGALIHFHSFSWTVRRLCALWSTFCHELAFFTFFSPYFS